MATVAALGLPMLAPPWTWVSVTLNGGLAPVAPLLRMGIVTFLGLVSPSVQFRVWVSVV